MFLLSVLIFAQDGVKIGDKVNDFELLNVDRRYISLSDYNSKKGVVLIFTCNHCPYAQAYEERIIQLHKDFADKGFPVIAVNPNDSAIVPADSYSNMIIRAEEKQYPFPYLLDDNHQTHKYFGATKTPHVFLLENKDNEFIVRYIGTIDDSPMDPSSVQTKYLANAIDALLSREKPDPEITKAIGCSIKIKTDI